MFAVRLMLAACLAAAGGCASLRYDHDEPAAGDELLLALEGGVVSLRAGEYERATQLFDHAYWLNEQRQSRSVSRGASALVTSDLALAYRPSPTELALLHYYGAQAWLKLGRSDEAAVEARRLSALLTRLADAEQSFEPDLMATLHDLSAAVFAVAGSWEEAAVSERLRDSFRESRALAPCDSCGELIVVAERGRVTHRVGRTLSVALIDGDLAAVAAAGEGAEGLAAAALAIDRAMYPRYCHWNHHAVCGWNRRPRRELDGSFSLVHVAWPELAAPRAGNRVQIDVADQTWDLSGIGGNVSASVAADFSRDAPARLSRAVARTVIRQAMLKAGDAAMDRAQEEKERNRKDKDKGKEDDNSDRKWLFAGIAAYIFAGASMIAERPDTRSWRTLPDELTVTRIVLPAGEHVVRRAGEAVAEVTMVPRGTSVVFVEER